MISHTERKGEDKHCSLSIAINCTATVELQGSPNGCVGNGWMMLKVHVKSKESRRNFKHMKVIKYGKTLPDEAL